MIFLCLSNKKTFLIIIITPTTYFLSVRFCWLSKVSIPVVGSGTSATPGVFPRKVWTIQSPWMSPLYLSSLNGYILRPFEYALGKNWCDDRTCALIWFVDCKSAKSCVHKLDSEILTRYVRILRRDFNVYKYK